MRVERKITLAAPCEEVWQAIRDPADWPRLMHGITRLEQKEEQEPGVGARYSMRMRVGSADIGGLVEIVEFDENRDMAWTSITGIDQRGRWRLRQAPGGDTEVTLRLSYDAPGGVLATIADRLSAPMVASNLEQSLENLRRELGGGGSLSEEGMGLAGRVAYNLGSARILAERGVILPMRPDKLLRVLTVLARWGRSPAAG